MRRTVAALYRHGQEGTSKYPPARQDLHDSYRERAACPLYTAIGVIDGRWKPMIFQRLSWRPHGFNDLRRAMPRVTSKVLREQLRQMQADGLVSRRHGAHMYEGVEFRLTPYGRTLGPVFQTLWMWGTKHLARRDAVRGTLVRPPATAAQAST